GDFVVQVRQRRAPIPHRDDDVALPTLRALRRRGGEFTPGGPIGPVRGHLQRSLTSHLREPRAHRRTFLPRLDAAIPRRRRVLERAERLRNLTRRLAAKLVACRAGVSAHDVPDPLALALDVWRDAVSRRARTGEVALWRQLKERQPVLRRVVL